MHNARSVNMISRPPASSQVSKSEVDESFVEEPRKFREYQLQKRIGSGHSAQVFLARDVRSEWLVALKVVPKSKGLCQHIRQEQAIQRFVDRKDPARTFLLPLLSSFHDSENWYLTTQYLGGQDMAIQLGAARKFPEDRARFYAAELVVTLEQLREARIIHRDIKPANILFTAEGHLRLTDFGLSKQFDMINTPSSSPSPHSRDDSTSVAENDAPFTTNECLGTPAYMSAKVHLGQPYSFEADLHAVGVLLYQMLTSRLPFGAGASSSQKIRKSVLNDSVAFRAADGVSKVTQHLIQGMLAKGKDQLTLEALKDHPYFKGIAWGRIAKQIVLPPWKPLITRSSVLLQGHPVRIGESYIRSTDPHPEFSYTSPRMDSLRKVPSPTRRVANGVINFFDDVMGKNVMPPLDPTTTPPKQHVKHANELDEPSSPTDRLAHSPESIPASSRKATKPPPGIILAIPPPPGAPRKPRTPKAGPGVQPARCSSTSKNAPSGQLPSPEIRKLLSSRPRGSQAPRRLHKDISKVPVIAIHRPASDLVAEVEEPQSPCAMTPSRRMSCALEVPAPTPVQQMKVEVAAKPTARKVSGQKIPSPINRINRASKTPPRSCLKSSTPVPRMPLGDMTNINRAPSSEERRAWRAGCPTVELPPVLAANQVARRTSLVKSSPKSDSRPKLKTNSSPVQVQEGVFPRTMDRAETFDNPDASYAGTKTKPATYSPKQDSRKAQDEVDLALRPMDKAKSSEHSAASYAAANTEPVTYPRPLIKDKVAGTPNSSPTPASRHSPRSSSLGKIAESRPSMKTAVTLDEATVPVEMVSVITPAQATVSVETVSDITPAQATVPVETITSIQSRPDFSSTTVGVFPRALEQSPKLEHPALAHADIKYKPADYPRPQINEKVRHLSEQPWHPSVAKAFTLHPSSPEKAPAKASTLRQLLLPSLVLARSLDSSPPEPISAGLGLGHGNFETGTPTLTDDARNGRPSPRTVRLSQELLKAQVDDALAQARCGVYQRATCDNLPSACGADCSGTGTHHSDCLSPSAPRNVFSLAWTRFRTAFQRCPSGLTTMLEPPPDHSTDWRQKTQ
ncbi:hypothetical protein D9615_001928 [Tricholomella constricta]|uniref:Protein kinase domain-containing protein n=1 Tax=Tricholomella constricta TaxID=117010 RepID=A0A8H5HNX1_9AGAR|nr:hypothetical protein D9615_001928 [Tricholomella constricta]